MDELKINYIIMSKKHQSKNDRIQLLTASFALTVGFLELFESFSELLIIIPILAFIISLVNVFIVIRYKWFDKNYGLKFEATVFRINGIMMLITALSFQFVGEHTVQYVYYIITILYLFIIPIIVTKTRSKLTIMFLSEKIVAMHILRTPKEYNWKNITSIIRASGLLKIKSKNKRKFKKYFLIFDNQDLVSQLDDFLKIKQNEHKFSLEIT